MLRLRKHYCEVRTIRRLRCNSRDETKTAIVSHCNEPDPVNLAELIAVRQRSWLTQADAQIATGTKSRSRCANVICGRNRLRLQLTSGGGTPTLEILHW